MASVLAMQEQGQTKLKDLKPKKAFNPSGLDTFNRRDIMTFKIII